MKTDSSNGEINNKKLVKKEIWIEVLFAAACTTLVFVIFMGQYLFSDVVTFGKTGDHERSCYAAFMKIFQFITTDQVIIGVDNGSLNGATEFFLRPNMPVIYAPLYLFAWLSKFFVPRAMYICFYALHMFVTLTYSQRLIKKYFKVNRYMGFVYAAFMIYILCVESWCISFYIITSLTVVLLYFSLEVANNKSVINSLLCILTMILAFTSGYMTLSFAVVIADIFFTLFYINIKQRKICLKESLSFLKYPIIAGIICIPYYIQVLIYVKEVVQSPMTFADAIYYQFKLTDSINVVSNFSITSSSGIEQLWAISIGYIACFVLAAGIRDKVFDKMERIEKWTCFLGLTAYIVIILWGNKTLPFSAWFFSLLPILGGMHIQLRYLMIVLPILYISIILVFKYWDAEKYKKQIKVFGISGSVFLILYLLLTQSGVEFPVFIKDSFIFEISIFLLFLYIILRKGTKSREALILWAAAIFIPSVSFFYQTTDVYTRANEIEQRSIIYDEVAIQNIDDFISKLDSKEKYRFIAYDSTDSVPEYLLGNYEWYGYSDYSICNYSGYELSLGTPQDYLKRFSWFSNVDWEYAANTRADFIMLDSNILESEDMLKNLINWNENIAYVGNGRLICKLNKFIPSIIAGERFVLDGESSLDNGYFYSHDLSNENVLDFKTDGNSFYRLTVFSETPSVIAFLPYANRNYHYYIDDKEIDVEIYDMQAVLRLDSGKHTVQIKYQNMMGKIGFILIFSIVFLLIALLILNFVFVVLKHLAMKYTQRRKDV